MAAAKRNRGGDPAIRAKIQVSWLIRRLQTDAMGGMDNYGKPLVLTDGQRASIKILLGKALPDLAHVTHAGDRENPVNVNINLGE